MIREEKCLVKRSLQQKNKYPGFLIPKLCDSLHCFANKVFNKKRIAGRQSFSKTTILSFKPLFNYSVHVAFSADEEWLPLHF